MGGSVFPSITGALINGIGTNILAGGDTKKGLLMNAALLAGSKGLNSPMGPSGNVANASTMANSQLPTAAFTNTPVVPAANTAPFANIPQYTPSSNVAVERPIGFLESTFNPNIQSSSMAPSFMEQVGSGASQVGQYAQQNPVLTNMALQSAQQALQQPEAQFAPAGQVNRGQIQGGDYMSLLNPQQSTVLRPQQISLLG